jgi:hypothetical protein
MSLLTLPGTILPSENTIASYASIPSLSPIAAPASDDSATYWEQLENEQQELASVTGTGAASAATAVKSKLSGLSSWYGIRGITLLLGLMLIAAAIFTHPTVINLGGKVAKAAAVAA